MAKILIVDDSKSMRNMIEMTLVDQGHEVIEAEDGLDALSKAEGHSFDAIITDINMPNMNGIELITELRKIDRFKSTPILCLTTESGDETKKKGKRAGATGWIVKPFKPEKLAKVISSVL